MRKLLQRTLLCATAATGFPVNCSQAANEQVVRIQIGIGDTLAAGLKGVGKLTGNVALAQASTQVSSVTGLAKDFVNVASLPQGIDKNVARVEKSVEGLTRLTGVALKASSLAGAAPALQAVAPYAGKVAGSIYRSHLESQASADNFERMLASAISYDKLAAQQAAIYASFNADPRNKAAPNPNGYTITPYGNNFSVVEPRASSTTSLFNKPTGSSTQDQQAISPNRPAWSDLSKNNAKGNSSPQPENTSTPFSPPKTNAISSRNPIVEAVGSKLSGSSSGPRATSPTNGSPESSAGGVRTGSSSPPVSSTALPEGGVRIAPSATSTPSAAGNSSRLAMAAPSNTPILDSNRISGPGGISLSRAAAEKLNLNIDFDGAFYADGRIVLSGRPQPKGIDAAIFLTSLRLACEPGDPSFSLDPDDGKAWTEEGRKLSNVVWEKLRPRFEPRTSRRKPTGLTVRVLSARQEYRSEWPKLLASYPNFKTRLVFRPEWLKQTRFGEILYKADVLLKELTAGTPTLRSESRLRAATVDKYIPSDTRSVARSLLETVERGIQTDTKNAWRGNRLWFDLVAQKDGDLSKDQINQPTTSVYPPRTDAGIALFQLLKRRNYVANESAGFIRTSLVVENGNALDLSQIYPQMFVRVHDTATGSDLPGNDPDLDVLSSDVNRRTEKYAAAYQELRDLTDIFRAYIAASKYAKLYPAACKSLSSAPLLQTEKTDTALPEHHISELFITLGVFETSKRWTSITSKSINGGIALRGKLFSEQRTTTGQPTPVTLELKREVEINKQQDAWQGASGRQFVALKVGRDNWRTPAPEEKPLPSIAVDIPESSGKIGRFELYRGARISGTKLKSDPLQAKYSKDPTAAMEECVKMCSADSNCVAFEVDQLQNQCNAYSTVLKATPDPKWAHGIWR